MRKGRSRNKRRSRKKMHNRAEEDRLRALEYRHKAIFG